MSSDESTIGYIEASQRLVRVAGREWNQLALREAAARGELKNTGWPMGVVLTKPDLEPKVMESGIEFRMHRDRADVGPGWEDFWSFQKDGSFYLARIFEEDYTKPNFSSSDGHPERPFWFDLRIWRIAEAVLHSGSLYRALGVAADEPYLLTIGHGGLTEREFASSDAGRVIHRGRFSSEDRHAWTKQVSADLVATDLESLTVDVCRGLFVLFAFAEVSDEVVSSIVGKFLNSRV